MTRHPIEALDRLGESAAGSGYRGTTEVAVVGLGPWGLATLERLVAVAGRVSVPTVVHVVEPGVPGAGIFSLDDPDYLLLNTPCGQHVIYPTAGPDNPPYAKSLFDWAVERGYRWVDGCCRVTGAGRAITPDDFLPRRLMGEWLRWSFEAIVASLPGNVSVRLHATSAVDVEPAAGGFELVHLADGRTFRVQHVILTTGHTPDDDGFDNDVHPLQPYPVGDLQDLIARDESVALSGLGLVAMDVLTALTVGRGGRFVEAEGRLRYERGGCEPRVYLFSRSGQPYLAKPLGASDPTGEYVPVICTPAAAAGLRTSDDGQPNQGSVDFRRDLLPLILAEMQVRFYHQSALIDAGASAAEEVSRVLSKAWSEGCFTDAVGRYAKRYGSFDAERHALGDSPSHPYVSSQDYQDSISATIEADVAEAMSEGAVSPVKAACESVRALRDIMRSVIEFQGLTLESYLELQSSLSNRMKALVAGPPVRRSQEILALVEAGVVELPWGPSPLVESSEEGGFVIRSTRLAQPHVRHVDHLVRGYLTDPTIARTRSPLVSRLAGRGRIRPFRYGDVEVGSIDLTSQSHPVGRDAEVQDRIWVFGSLTEGVRYFTQYVPSPKSRVRAFVDAEACAEKIFASVAPALSEDTDAFEVRESLVSAG